jgi:hypothetical protein
MPWKEGRKEGRRKVRLLCSFEGIGTRQVCLYTLHHSQDKLCSFALEYTARQWKGEEEEGEREEKEEGEEEEEYIFFCRLFLLTFVG